MVNLDGHFVMPGFNDAHLHLAEAGFERQTVNLVGVKSLAEFRDRIRARVATAAPGEWIAGRWVGPDFMAGEGVAEPLGCG